jgi:deazaflavin-dependent oxidoreductase (nitroreductase family)
LLTYLDEPDGPVIFGTNAGLDRDPAWVLNLRAQPSARMRRNGQWSQCTARPIADATTRERLWDAVVSINPSYGDYLATLTRPVPIIELQCGR